MVRSWMTQHPATRWWMPFLFFCLFVFAQLAVSQEVISVFQAPQITFENAYTNTIGWVKFTTGQIRSKRAETGGQVPVIRLMFELPDEFVTNAGGPTVCTAAKGGNPI